MTHHDKNTHNENDIEKPKQKRNLSKRNPSPKSKKNTTQKNKFNTDLCDNRMTFQDCEVAILRHAIDISENIKGHKLVSNDDIKAMLKIVEDFIIRKKLVCYGGTAVNNILPKSAQFYDRDIEIPDYDFFSENALDDAKELADIYFEAGYTDVEAKSGIHMGTFKVYVNFIPIADITYLEKGLFRAIHKESIKIAGIHYAPPNYLRMGMYLELSRPLGEVSRWEKVLKRLNLLNEYFPIKPNKCQDIDFQRTMESQKEDSERLYVIIRDTFIDMGVVFFGGYATTLYSKYMPEEQQRLVEKIPDFDVLSDDPEKTAMIMKETLVKEGFKQIKTIKHKEIGEIIPRCVEVRIGKETLALIYKPIACHSYNKIKINNKEINIATIDTILTCYLAFLYTDMHYYDKDRLLCMSKFLFDVQHKNRLEQRGLLRRFTVKCFGKQDMMEEIRAAKAAKYKELRHQRNSHEYQMWFLKYAPGDLRKSKTPVVLKDANSEKKESIEELAVKEDTEKNTEKKPEKKEKKEAAKPKGISSIFGIFGRNKKQQTRKMDEFLV
jgi:hypothetical protein